MFVWSVRVDECNCDTDEINGEIRCECERFVYGNY